MSHRHGGDGAESRAAGPNRAVAAAARRRPRPRLASNAARGGELRSGTSNGSLMVKSSSRMSASWVGAAGQWRAHRGGSWPAELGWPARRRQPARQRRRAPQPHRADEGVGAEGKEGALGGSGLQQASTHAWVTTANHMRSGVLKSTLPRTTTPHLCAELVRWVREAVGGVEPAVEGGQEAVPALVPARREAHRREGVLIGRRTPPGPSSCGHGQPEQVAPSVAWQRRQCLRRFTPRPAARQPRTCSQCRL